MSLRSALKALLVLALALPLIQAVLFWVRGLLASMGDAEGAAIIGNVSTACQIVWTVGLVGLVIVLAIFVLNERPPEDSGGT